MEGGIGHTLLTPLGTHFSWLLWGRSRSASFLARPPEYRTPCARRADTPSWSLPLLPVPVSRQGVGNHAPENVTIVLYKGNVTSGTPLDLIMKATLIGGTDATMSIKTSGTYDSVDLNVQCVPPPPPPPSANMLAY